MSRRGADPYTHDGVPGKYTRLPLTSCNGRRYVYAFHMARIEPPEDEELYRYSLQGYEKGNAIEVLEIYEISAGGYLRYGIKSLAEGIAESDRSKTVEGKKLLRRSIERGSEEAQKFWEEKNSIINSSETSRYWTYVLNNQTYNGVVYYNFCEK